MNLSLALVVAGLLGASNTAYVRSRVEVGNPNAHCLRWQAGALPFTQSGKGLQTVAGEAEFAAITSSFGAWQAVMSECGNLTVSETARSTSREAGYDPRSGHNANLVLFREKNCSAVAPKTNACWTNGDCSNLYDCWQYPLGTIALTTTTYDKTTGQIFDADIELNASSSGSSSGFVFTTVNEPSCAPGGAQSQSCVSTDIQNTMTHEIGHLLGLDHVDRSDSTMFATAPVGQTSKRSLDQGTKQFVCDVYPKSEPSRDCVLEVARADLGESAGCAAIPGGLGGGLLILALGARRRRTARP